MFFQDDFRAWCFAIFSDQAVQQIAPLIVLLLIPLLVLSLVSQVGRNSLFYSLAMVFESLGLGLPWNWSNGHSASGHAIHEKKKSKKSHPRNRAEQVAMNGNAKHGPESSKEDIAHEIHYPGLINISGTYCFMNSTLQAMASLCYLQPHIDSIHAKAELLDVPTPVIDALQVLLHSLNTPNLYRASLQPLDIIKALSDHNPGKHNSLFSSREHQDAQELFQLLSECIKTETAAVDTEGYRDRGLGGLAQLEVTSREIGKSVFDGLTANRRSCLECGYTEAVMHFAFDNWQLAVPRLVSNWNLEECLADYTRLELLTDCICRKCSLLATHKRLLQEVEKASGATKPDASPSTSKKKRAKEVKRMATLVKAALDEGRIEDDLKGVKMEKVHSKASTKQAMIARPPPVLVLHLNRSMHLGHYASKNNVSVLFQELLDLTPFTTSGKLSTVPSVPISSPPPSLPRSTTPTPATYSTPRTIYRLSAVVCHYGQHSFGHYICFRRKPRPLSAGPKRFDPPKIADPLVYDKESTPVWEDEEPSQQGRGWLRISDESVRECGIETVLQEGSAVFMLYYERVQQPRLGIYPLRNSPRSSEETLKPETITAHVNGSASSLLSESEVRVPHRSEEKKSDRMMGPRIVRSVAAGRGRSLSVVPSEGESSRVSSSETERTPKRTETSLPNGIANGDAHVSQLSSPEPIPPAPESTPSTPFAPTAVPADPTEGTLSIPPPTPHLSPEPPPPRIHSPRPVHAPVGPSMVGLRA